MNFNTLLLATQEHGLALVLLIVFLIWAYRIAKWLKPRIETILDNSINATSNHEEKLMKGLPATLEKTIQIQTELRELMDKIGADRIYVFEYHNGNRSLSGVDFIKCSNTYELVARGISPEQKNLQELPISMMSMWTRRLMEGSCLNINNIRQLKDMGDFSSYEMLKAQGIHAIYAVGIKDNKDRLIGFLGVDFNSEGRFVSFEDTKDLDKMAIRLSILLNEDNIIL